jgi:hypothetical protein
MLRRTLAVGAAVCAAAAIGAAPALAATATPAPTTDAQASTPMCATSQLTAALGGGDAGAGQLYRYLVITNRSRSTCHLTGYPGLSLLDAKGRQIGPAATRDPRTYGAVVLRPGASASDTIHTVNRQTSNPGECLPASAELRVYPPGNRDALVIRGSVTNCDHLLTVTPLAPGSTGNPPQGGSGAGSPVASAVPGAPVASATSGGQVSVVPSGAPDTGAVAPSGSHFGTVAVAGGAAGALVVGGAGAVAVRRRRSAR